ncbi:MarR family winged helix-turn-helix transcriptional regulator [Streptomyces sp. NPDC051310]|uniref:MarR family winged helix-turn-helix transcriptional regulator n=1 Tax=Streptomyces sp. NPDC051310 TaxID=3365649 RepID=UPI0037ADB95B
MTASETNALATFADGRGRTISELGAAAGTRPTTLTSVLDRLERRGHITRSAHPGDRRAVIIGSRPTAPPFRGTAAAGRSRTATGPPHDTGALHASTPPQGPAGRDPAGHCGHPVRTVGAHDAHGDADDGRPGLLRGAHPACRAGARAVGSGADRFR